jgi:uncharacterized membrane protein
VSEEVELLLSNPTLFKRLMFLPLREAFSNSTSVLTVVLWQLLLYQYFFLPAVMSFISLKQFKPTICAASNTDRLSASVKKEGTYKQEKGRIFILLECKNTNSPQITLINSQQCY